MGMRHIRCIVGVSTARTVSECAVLEVSFYHGALCAVGVIEVPAPASTDEV